MLFFSKERLSGRLYFVLSLAIMLTVGGSSTAADLYKWTDNEGRVYYSDRPPNQDVKNVSQPSIRTAPVRAVEPNTPKSKPSVVKQWEEVWAKRQQALQEERRLIEEDRTTARVKQVSDACHKARAVVQLLEDNSNGIVYRRNKHRPEVISAGALTRSEIQRELKKWRKKVTQTCPKDIPLGTGIRVYKPRELPFASTTGRYILSR